ncbi:unnamed protein product, partial [Urochloa humidicola]
TLAPHRLRPAALLPARSRKLGFSRRRRRHVGLPGSAHRRRAPVGLLPVQGAVDVDIGANPSAEGGDDEGVDDQAVKVVDIVDTFRLQEQPAFDKKQFVTFIKRYIKNLTAKLEPEKAEEFKKGIEGATKFLLGKLKDLQFFVGESMHDDGSLVFAYYKDGATDPTFLYFAHGLKEIKC